MAGNPTIDEVDRALIAELIIDGRASYAKLAPAVGLSQASVRTRVQRLLADQIITITGRVDPATFGLGIFAIAFVQVSGPTEPVARALAEVSDVVFVTVCAGQFEILVEVRCHTAESLIKALDAIRVTEGVGRVMSSTVLHYDKQNWAGVGHRELILNPAPKIHPSHVIDDIDRQLLIKLMADGRASYAQLAPTVGLSHAAVRERVIDLIDTNVISIQAHPEPTAMGIAGFAGVAVKARGPVAHMVQQLIALPETTLVLRTIGTYDVLAEVWFDDNDHLCDLLDNIRATCGLSTVECLPYLDIVREDFGSGLRR
tara:strand:- start:326 stop:1267 length:942 start_codon:yes stop_codon:yes gene_type:complete